MELSLPIQWLGQWHAWQTVTEADPTGMWHLNVPVWTSAVNPASQSEAWLNVTGEAPLALEISENAVRNGLEVPVTP